MSQLLNIMLNWLSEIYGYQCQQVSNQPRLIGVLVLVLVAGRI